MQEDERIRMAEDKKQDMERQDNAYQSMLKQMNQQSSTVFSRLFDSNTDLQRTQGDMLKQLLHQQQAQSVFMMRRSFHPMHGAAYVPETDEHEYRTASEGPPNEEEQQK